MSIFDYQIPSRKLVFDYYPVYAKLRGLLSDTGYSNDYSNYSQEQFDELVVNLLFSYFHVDRAGSHGLLYDALSGNTQYPDHSEQMLADRALEIIEEIDNLTKIHIPMFVEEYGSPFPSSAILDVQLVGTSKMLVEITKEFYDSIQKVILLKESELVDHTTHIEPIPRTTK